MRFDTIWDILGVILGPFIIGLMLYAGCIVGGKLISLILWAIHP